MTDDNEIPWEKARRYPNKIGHLPEKYWRGANAGMITRGWLSPIESNPEILHGYFIPKEEAEELWKMKQDENQGKTYFNDENAKLRKALDMAKEALSKCSMAPSHYWFDNDLVVIALEAIKEIEKELA